MTVAATRSDAGGMARRLLFAGLVAAWWSLLLAWFLPLPLDAPLRPADTLDIDGAGFVPAIGAAQREDAGLRVTAMAGANGALQVHRPAPFQAEALPILRYRFDGLPRTLELVFVFRQSEHADDVRVVTVPGVSRRAGAIDLTQVPGWEGTIVEVGFAEFPGAQSVPPSRAFRPFRLEQVQFQSPSWSGAWAVRMNDWFGRQSWEMLSLSALGPDSARPRGLPLPPMLVLGALGTVLLVAAILGWRGRRLATAAFALAVAAWLVLDLRWLHNLHGRHAGTRDAYAGLSAAERGRLQPDQATYDAAARVRAALRDEPPDTRIFIDAGTDYTRARLLYHLLPLNVAPVNLVTYGTPEQRAGAIVVLFDARAPRYDAGAGELHFADVHMPATPIVLDGALRIFRLGPAP